ncbi:MULTISPECIES: hypothetical protein [unclassified Acinetobacter]|uniref:hypothetical protein n=1 Tax=unclassified Acinetobacter TaxID=196816 RepID=UPI0015D22DBC|nr:MULTISPECIES: hypothetical protein [unclassified Acinetobacter]UUS64301.1 hypothetical protein MST18_10550 [Acinetobacter sp. YH12068_T]
MFNYQKTELGFQTLKDRQLALNARQRRLLLLIGSDDFNQMPVHYQQRIAEATLLEQLMDLGLIQPITAHDHQRLQNSDFSAFNTPKIASTKTSDRIAQENVTLDKISMPTMEVPHTHSQHEITDSLPMDAIGFIPHQFNQAIPENITSNNPVLAEQIIDFIEHDFDELQNFMCSYLQRYCGLMAKKLMLNIQQATDIAELKACQMQWITCLNESNIQPKLLQHALQQINYSIKNLQQLV